MDRRYRWSIFAVLRPRNIQTDPSGLWNHAGYLSLKSHDPSQRANGFPTLAGGIIITFTKEILNMITG